MSTPSTAAIIVHSKSIVQICSWCLPRTVRILGAPEGLQDLARVSFELDERGYPKAAWAFLNAQFHEFKLSHGICPECARKMRPEPARIQ
jgi:hypothetical protein